MSRTVWRDEAVFLLASPHPHGFILLGPRRTLHSMLARLVAEASVRYTRKCLETSNFTLSADTQDVLRERWDRGTPTIFVYWHDEFPLNLLLPMAWKRDAIRSDMP